MQRPHSQSSFLKISPILSFCALLATLAVPAHAQRENNSSLSDVSGFFPGNFHTDEPLTPSVPSVGRVITSIDNFNREILTTPDQPAFGETTRICIHLSASLAQVAPFSGCSNIDWKAYNRAVKDAKELRRELTRLAQEQKAALSANPSPEARAAITRRMVLLEKTTTVLETTAEALVILGQALDKAR
ncbi:hypothetical protein IAD21_06148 [Abditibacteriota bacterium]|nr:hypothetical protein IAD21_06148 [Abditibacteriota bacterium]